ncbi:hypothetical protein CWE09_05550 [Aliidiomarina minuta]|uniref:Uncharacterized protein n=1 Tax=Aliidiomarina minuta TaxID=880057 RepID=A0A432W7V7_9GAMM|nr:hypothetical protein [Aliidiomarina minuta]RUO26180.1 hypothetical protein CWE09_05550 [Aliidiomarina minuta]
MANQDILFPLLPRNTQVDMKSTYGRITRVQKKPRSPAVSDEEDFDDTQEARVRQRLRDQSRQKQGPPEPSPVAEDPRKDEKDDDDDEHKGRNLDIFA